MMTGFIRNLVGACRSTARLPLPLLTASAAVEAGVFDEADPGPCAWAIPRDENDATWSDEPPNEIVDVGGEGPP
jgi:hypothetical protein